jgi:heterodisulfide reductase subunit C
LGRLTGCWCCRLMHNVRSCLQRCNFVNKVYSHVYALKNEAYSSANQKHEEMLEQLWTNLKPEVRREGGRITKEWGEIGFQGRSCASIQVSELL